MKPEDRVDRVVSELLKGKRLPLRGGDAEEKAAMVAAARLAAASRGPHRMSPSFRKRLKGSLTTIPELGWVSRRSALVAGLGLVAGAAAGAMAGRSMAPAAKQLASGGPIEPVGGRWIDVAALTDLTEGQAKRVTAGGVSAYLFRRGDSVSAVSSVCTHLPCELRWNGGSGLLDCPCHPVSFTPAGQPTGYTSSLPALNLVHVRVTAVGRVEVMGTA